MILPMLDDMSYAFSIATSLRNARINTELNYTKKSVKSMMNYANRIGVAYVIVVGEEEEKQNLVTIKNSLKNANNLKIIKTHQGKNEIIYDGKYIDSFEYELTKEGIYNFTLIFESDSGILKEIKLKSVKYTKNPPNISNKNWWEL
jgi:hypothetical protein